ncbi:hypothetical protein IFM89_010318 [Coptis chinensis]|uniref:Uncharacterized protein n=1 Tax=Coptis chinensis TaxID=261450 RepID=A0A835LTY6_9MAGN|nr:hypothetical protein IFM89_010318 [Coptis chinensis]
MEIVTNVLLRVPLLVCRHCLSLRLSISTTYDILSVQCQQTEPEFGPTMSEIVESLELLNDRSLADGIEGESFDLSLQTTNTRFISSPVTS